MNGIRVPSLATCLLLGSMCVNTSACGKSTPDSTAPAAASKADPQAKRLQLLKEAAERVKAAREKRRQELRAVGDVKLTAKKLIGKKGHERIELAFEFDNKSDKPLMMAEGTIVFSDASGKALRKLKIPFTKPIAAGKSTTKRGTFPLDASSDADHAFVKMPLNQLKTEWIPTLYRFQDGTQMQGE